jgi:hypothetical protein
MRRCERKYTLPLGSFSLLLAVLKDFHCIRLSNRIRDIRVQPLGMAITSSEIWPIIHNSFSRLTRSIVSFALRLGVSLGDA